MNEAPEQKTPAEEAAAETPAPVAAEPAAETVAPAEKPEEKAPAKEEKPQKRKIDAAGIALDALLVGMLVGVIGGGIWYLNEKLSVLRVPTPMEMALQKKIELCQARENLQDKAYHADEQLHMRRRLAALVEQQHTLQRNIEEKRQAIEAAHRQVLGLQHEIRQEDKTSRSVAKGLLPGLFIGDASTITGRVYRNATIHRIEDNRIEGNRISLRTPEGQVRFPLRELVKDNLPDIARYAFGIDDLVDMSDFELAPGAAAPKPRKGKLIKAEPKAGTPAAPDAADYEGEGGAPVVDTDANRNSTLTGEGGEEPDAPTAPTDTWTPPEGELPL